MRPYRPRILMVADRADWAYDHLAHYVLETLGHRYDFYLDYLALYCPASGAPRRTGLRRAWRALRQRLRRRVLPAGEVYDLICYLGWYFPWCATFPARARGIIQGIYTDGFPPQGGDVCVEPEIDMETFVRRYLAGAQALACGSPGIHARYRAHVPHAYLVPGAINTALYRPRRRGPEDPTRLVVGWTGDPSRRFKGFYEYVVPAVELAARRYPGITLKTRFSGPLRTLPRFYGDVDVLLIASDADAGPSSFLEAGACGVPAISTAIGLPAEFIHPGENGLFVARDVAAMADALVYVYEQRAHLRAMGARIREDIVARGSYPARAALWQTMFDETLARVGVEIR